MILRKRHVSAYWHHAGLYLEQLSGIADGKTMTHFQGPRFYSENMKNLYIMQLNGDLGDLEAALNMKKEFRVRRGGCSAFVKIVGDNQDLIGSHNTWTTYQSMLRVIKLHDLKFGQTSKSTGFHSASVKFSSYPGYITSVDDFYVTSNKLAVFETTIENNNASLWKYVQPSTLPTSIRGVIATRLATDGASWAALFKNFNSGTYNNEWMVLDYNKWQRREKTGILTVTEQMPGFIYTEDYSERLYSKSYYASYNVPSMPTVFKLSNNTGKVEESGALFNYSNCPRALIFARNQSMVHDISSALALMRYNNFKHDPLSLCKGCNPPYSAELAISAR